jgi:TonB family protein
MYFNFDGSHPETPSIDRAISPREGLLLSLVLHAVFALLIVFGPQIPFIRAAAERAAAERARLAELALERQREQPTFVFVQPRIDTPAPLPPPRAELSDQDRMARAPERSPNPTNPLPFSRGNSSERVEATPQPRPNRETGRAAADPARSAEDGSDAAKAADAGSGLILSDRGRPQPNDRNSLETAPRGLAGAIGNALRNIEKYVPESFNNQQGGVSDFGSTIQFDTKGVEFGPWIRRFVAQVKRNWFIPYAAMAMKGHVVITFNVHRDGSITDLTVLQPSSVDAFTNAAYNALAASNPTQPLPPEYPSETAFFTVTFYYNENPGGG